MTITPDTTREVALFGGGARLIAGVDEVGRGAGAGPVGIGVCLVSRGGLGLLPDGLRDSKQLSATRREALFQQLKALDGGGQVVMEYGVVWPAEIDTIGMSKALGLAAQRALEQAKGRTGWDPDQILLDGPYDYIHDPRVTPVVKGDASSVVMAAASVWAKVLRDAWMSAADSRYPGYGFAKGAGYLSAAHRAGLARLGPCALHRMTWKSITSLGLGPDDRPAPHPDDARLFAA